MPNRRPRRSRKGVTRGDEIGVNTPRVTDVNAEALSALASKPTSSDHATWLEPSIINSAAMIRLPRRMCRPERRWFLRFVVGQILQPDEGFPEIRIRGPRDLDDAGVLRRDADFRLVADAAAAIVGHPVEMVRRVDSLGPRWIFTLSVPADASALEAR